MSTRDMYTEVPAPYSWEVASAGDARFTWEYDDGMPSHASTGPKTSTR